MHIGDLDFIFNFIFINIFFYTTVVNIMTVVFNITNNLLKCVSCHSELVIIKDESVI